jgi:hypothetical protein
VAARPDQRSLSPTLGAGHVEAIKLRLSLLLAYADERPKRCKHGPALRLLIGVLAIVFALPHGGRTEPLDTVHAASERAASFFVGR